MCIASPSGSSSFELVDQKMHAKKTATMTGTTTKGELIAISTLSLRNQDTKGAGLILSALHWDNPRARSESRKA
jgi:hypothetical protein